MKEPTQFLTNESGERVAVIIPIADYEEIIERLEDLDDIRAYDEAKASGETPVPLEQALAELESERNRK
jgi:PHD/YefM family antitoxin component YafN of YafNO toxin-antitoxin module